MEGRIQVRDDFYQQLGLPDFAPMSDVVKAYRRLALIHHPDRGGDPEKMKQINYIYDVLKNHKEAYDRWLYHRRNPAPAVVFSYSFDTTTAAYGWTSANYYGSGNGY